MVPIIGYSTIAVGLVCAAFAFAIAHDSRKPGHRRVAQAILLASLAALPAYVLVRVVQLALLGGEIQIGGKFSNSAASFASAPLEFVATAIAWLIASTLPLAAAWPVVGALFRGKQDPE